MDKLLARDIAADFFYLCEEPHFNDAEINLHTDTFMLKYFNLSRLGRAWGYNQEDALRFQLQEYAREAFGWSDIREGE